MKSTKSLVRYVFFCLVTCLPPSSWAAGPAAVLPSEIAERGTLRIGIETNSKPMEFEDPKTGEFTGFNVELLRAISEVMGLKPDFQIAAFASLGPSLDTGRIDIIGSHVADTPTRRRKNIFIDYLDSGQVFYVSRDAVSRFPEPSYLCGASAGGVEHAASYELMLQWSRVNCPPDRPLNVVATKGAPDTRLQIKQGRLHAGSISAESAINWQSDPSSEFVQIGEIYHKQTYGFPVLKDNSELANAILAALNAIRDSGRYDALLRKYHLQERGIRHFMIDGGEE